MNLLKKFTSIQPTINLDLPNYISWVKWCNDSAKLLNENKNSIYNDWRPRDVEIAIFTYQRQGWGNFLEIL